MAHKKHHDKHHAYHEKHKHHSGGKHTAHSGETGDTGTKEGHTHTGNIRHSDMTSLIDGHGKPDPHAHGSYREANDAYDMCDGMSPKGDESGEGSSTGGHGMEGNATYT